ncbi:MAG: hypothetical protein FWF49_02415 [Oscillospiraceae bacterium]|nr:hypothetical protein [Oscillospiraceae bacterium]
MPQVEETAKQLAERLMAAYKEAEPSIMDSGIYIPRGDAAYLRWTAFVQAAVESLAFIRFDNSNLPPHRDGHYITMAHADSGADILCRNPQESPVLYYLNGPMINWQVIKYGMWRTDHNWVKREPLRDYGKRDIGLCGAFRDGTLPRTPETAEAYQYLLDNGFVVKDGDQYILNVIFADTADIYKRYKAALPNLKELCEPLIATLTAALDAEMVKYHPAHILPQLHMAAHIMSTYTLSPLILKCAVESGFLPPLTGENEKAATILVGKFGAAFV